MEWKIKNVRLSLVTFGVTVLSTSSVFAQSVVEITPRVTPPTRVDVTVPVDNRSRQPLGLKPRVLHKKPSEVKYWKGLRRDRVIFKLMDGLEFEIKEFARGKRVLTLDGVSQKTLNQLELTTAEIQKEVQDLNKIISSRNVTAAQSLFTQAKQAQIKARVKAEKKTAQVHSHLSNYYWLALNRRTKGENIGTQLNKLKIIEIAYLPPIPQPADIPPATPDFEFTQGYLDDASSNGIDARYAWGFDGGRGASMRFIDIEAGWNLNHEDLPAPFFSLGFGGINGSVIAQDDHGTAVLGVLVAKNDGTGVTGIVSDAEYSVVSNVRLGGLGGLFGGRSGLHDMSVATAINDSSARLRPGDVIIIEQHSPGPESPTLCDGISDPCQDGFVPMEFFPATFDAIRQATNNGRIIVEAAGNGGVDLDSNVYANRFNKQFVNSGAIMVGASVSTANRPNGSTNYGSRIDLHAWGRNVATTGYGDGPNGRVNGNDRNQFYTSDFGGTSAATPIVAGAVLSIQGILRAHNLNLKTADEMINLLQSTGTPQEGNLIRLIGPMPNLKAAIDLINPPPGTTLPPVLNPPGQQYKLECNLGEFLVGLKGLSGAYIDKVQAICSDASNVLSETGAVGGNGAFSFIGFSAQAYELKCSQGSAVTGIQGFSGFYVDSMRLECHSVDNNGTPSGVRTTTNSVGGNGGNQFGPFRCADGEIASGISGRSGQYIDAIQLVCNDVTPTVSNVTSATLGPQGGPGGQDFNSACDNGETIIGISVGSGAWLDNIAPRCNVVSNTGQWGNTTITRNRTGGNPLFAPAPTNINCPPNHAVVGYSGKAGSYIDQVSIRCKRLATASSTIPTANIVTMQFAGGSGGSDFGPYICPNELVVTSLFGRSGQYIDRLGMRCGN